MKKFILLASAVYAQIDFAAFKKIKSSVAKGMNALHDHKKLREEKFGVLKTNAKFHSEDYKLLTTPECETYNKALDQLRKEDPEWFGDFKRHEDIAQATRKAFIKSEYIKKKKIETGEKKKEAKKAYKKRMTDNADERAKAKTERKREGELPPDVIAKQKKDAADLIAKEEAAKAKEIADKAEAAENKKKRAEMQKKKLEEKKKAQKEAKKRQKAEAKAKKEAEKAAGLTESKPKATDPKAKATDADPKAKATDADPKAKAGDAKGKGKDKAEVKAGDEEPKRSKLGKKVLRIIAKQKRPKQKGGKQKGGKDGQREKSKTKGAPRSPKKKM